MRRAGESGQVLPLIACCLAVLMGFGGIGVDVGYMEYWQQQQQTATDAAAAGGADSLLKAGCPNQTSAKNAALADAALNGFTTGSNITLTAVNPPSSGPFVNNVCAVDVTMSTSHVATFFAKLFGYPGGVTETTHAAAVVTTTGGGCIYLLSSTVSSNFNGDHITALKCGALINDTANFNNATVNVMSIGYAGAAPNTNGATFTTASPAPMLPVADPCPEIAGCAYLSANPPSTSNCTSFQGNGYHGSMNPGCYSDINLNGAVVTLNPGLYVLNGGTNFNGASISGSGVTLYVTQSGTPPNFNGIANATLSPPSTGNDAGVLYYQVPANAGSPNLNGSSENFSGLVYAPAATSVNFNGADGGYLVLVFGAANFNGSVAQDFATPPPYTSLVKQAVVAQ